jgi:hypothetical protein
MIQRTYVCAICNHVMNVELRSDQWAQEPPDCPVCVDYLAKVEFGNGSGVPMQQEFKAPSIIGSLGTRAADTALKIAAEDYNVADIQVQSGSDNGPPKVRYKDTNPDNRSSWGAQPAALEQAIAAGRQTREQFGSGLDIIKTMPDLIALSKIKSAKVW